MEIAEQWQREWTGTAEYGKVTEGGVTRRIARAMEVLHASKPGTRVRVMRAAYHSSAGPGVPASSYMLHSSRRVISSGANYIEPPTLPSLRDKPLELSSTPLDSSPDFNSETENYKVTEPDDLDISEPSKWRGSTSASTVRMPSEESSSPDNASIIDLDSRTGNNLNRKNSYDSESSDIQWNKGNTRTSPLLSAPVVLNTLKYKSLLNSSNDWHNRRKSYSFEDTVPSNESMSYRNDNTAIESSTDSGICKSSEIVNENTDNISHQKLKDDELHDETFKDWLSKNRQSNFYNGTKYKTYKYHDIVEEQDHNNVTLQTTGKMSINLPTTEVENRNYQHSKIQTNDHGLRKVKKVEFCKTEVHFAAETGKVNIIATDEKPPPSNDFRKRRSMFLPLHDMPEKPITLFGEKINEMPVHNRIGNILNNCTSEIGEIDENTAATKSILKNKIPKPKPYLLGENMEFGLLNDSLKEDQSKDNIPVLTAVSLINKQLQSQRRHSDEITSGLAKDIKRFIHKSHDLRTYEKGPAKDVNLIPENIDKIKPQDRLSLQMNKLYDTERSPIHRRTKTRQLRDSDLTYFGVENKERNINNDTTSLDYYLSSDDSASDSILQSVRLIQKVTNSVCSSETELDDVPEYQNIPIFIDNAPVPAPRARSKYNEKSVGTKEVRILKPIVEQENDNIQCTRRTRFRRQESITTNSNRSVSEPPKRNKYNSLEKTHGQQVQSTRCTKTHMKEEVNHKVINKTQKTTRNKMNMRGVTPPVYVNLNIDNKNTVTALKKESSPQRLQRKSSQSRVNDKRDSNLKHSKKNLQSEELVKTKISHNDSTCNDVNSFTKNQKILKKQPIEKTGVYEIRNKNEPLNKKYSVEDKIVNRNDSADKNNTSQNNSIYGKSGNNLSLAVSNKIKRKDERKISNDNINNRVDSKKHSSNENTKKELPMPKVDDSRKIKVHNSNSAQINPTDNMKSRESTIKSSNNKKSRKSEYVINYDDKNGTVSSVCKIKQGPAGTSRKKISKEFLEENDKESPLKNKALNKIALLQFADHPRTRNEPTYADRKWKSKIYEQKSCQLL